MRTTWSVLATSISLHCQTLLFPELSISQICFPGFIRAMLLLPIFETNFHIDLFIIINTRVYPYIYVYALKVLGSARDISAIETRV